MNSFYSPMGLNDSVLWQN